MPNGYVTDVWVDEDGDGYYNNGEYPNNNGSFFTFTNATPIGMAPGTYTVGARVEFVKNSTTFIRDIPGNAYTVTEERDGYIASYEDAKAFIRGATTKDLANAWSATGTVGGYAATPSDWDSWWATFFDGVNDPAHDNYEVDHLEFRDTGNMLTGNILMIYLQDGTATSIFGIPEQVFDQFRQYTHATLTKEDF